MHNRFKKTTLLALISLLSVIALHSQTTYGDTIFIDTFGQHATRVTTPYMPAGSYTFAPANGTSSEKEIQDNYYAVVAPLHIADANQTNYFWTSTSPTTKTPAGARTYTTDHTGNADGAVLVINAGNTINYVYKRSVKLKTGFRYRFAFWIYVVRPSSQFGMEVINSTNNTTNSFTGPMLTTEGVWTLYTLDFPVPISNVDSNVVSVGLQNKYSLTQGNDYYIDDILLSTLHTDTLKVTSSSGSQICEGTSISLTANATGGAQPLQYSWTGPNGFTSTSANPVILNSTVAMSGVYTVTVVDALGQKATGTTTIGVHSIPLSNFTQSANRINSKHNSVDFVLIPQAGITYLWDFGDGETDTSPSPTHVYDSPIPNFNYKVTLTAIDSLGCSSTTSSIVEATLFVPNVFTPNGDGVNDLFMPLVMMQIYNRYGQKLYDGVEGWDGTYNGQKLDNDTYFYMITYIDKNLQLQTLKGAVTLKK